MVFKAHQIRLYLDAPLYLAFIKLQSDKRLGRSYAGLLCVVEGLDRQGYLSEKQYVAHKKRYSVPLNKDPKQVTLEEHEAVLRVKQLNKTFSDVMEQWPQHPDEGWRQHWIRKATENGDVPNAVKLLAYVEEHKK